MLAASTLTIVCVAPSARKQAVCVDLIERRPLVAAARVVRLAPDHARARVQHPIAARAACRRHRECERDRLTDRSD